MKENERQFIRVNGLGFGEETKGNTVQWLVREFKAHTVWRSGGWQGGHHIVHDDGREQAFSFFGAGTFEGARTYLKHMVISPGELFNEALELESKEVPNPLDLIAIDRDCLTTTPFHSGISRLREIMRGTNKKGTVGKGVGEALKDAQNPDIAIRAGEFQDSRTVKRKLENIRKLKLTQAQLLLASHQGTIPKEAYQELEILQDESLIPLTVDACLYLADLVAIVNEVYLDDLLAKGGTIVNEVSHGTLHHPWYGFVPHVTQIDPTSQDVMETVRKHNYTGRSLRFGVVRSFLTRHGAGPFVSFSPEFAKTLTETHNNAGNDWLGDFMTGHFDIIALQYSLAISGGRETFNGLVMSYLDALSKRKEWQVCEAYEYQGKPANLKQYFQLDGDKIVGIKVHPNTRDQAHYQHQLQLTELLKNCHPVLKTLTATPTQNLEQVFLEYVEDKLDLPVVGAAYGPKVTDRHFRRSF